MKCQIGIPVRYNELSNRYQCSTALIDQLIAIDVIPVLIYPLSNYIEYVNQCDGLLLAGGDDIDPQFYNEKQMPETKCVNKEIDELDFKLLDLFVKANKPVLGICRGIQVIGVAFGVPLNQHINHHQRGVHSIMTHPHSSFMQSIHTVNSYHHQSLSSVPDGFVLSAVSSDGCIEAIEMENIWGVQWHPELDENDCVLPRFVENILHKKIEKNQDR